MAGSARTRGPIRLVSFHDVGRYREKKKFEDAEIKGHYMKRRNGNHILKPKMANTSTTIKLAMVRLVYHNQAP